MGCANDGECPCPWSCYDNNPPVIENDFFPVYTAFKEAFNSIQKDVIKQEKIYLISTQSIDQFIKIINNSKILELIKEKKDDKIKNEENNLRRKKTEFKKINNIKIYDSYKECADLAQKDDDVKNEFIIANKTFIEKINIEKIDNIDEKYVLLNIDRNNSKMDIDFPVSHKNVNIIEKRTGIYKFVEN